MLASPEVRTYKIHVDLREATIEADRDIHLVVSARPQVSDDDPRVPQHRL
jgi:hypothetical protein